MYIGLSIYKSLYFEYQVNKHRKENSNTHIKQLLTQLNTNYVHMATIAILIN